MDQAGQQFSSLKEGLTSFAATLLRNEEDAQDVIQDVFRECVESGRKLNRSYLFQLVRSRSLNKLRAQSRYLRAIEAFSDFCRHSLDLGNDHKDSVADILNSLPARHREVMILRIKAELSLSEISQILGIPEGTVKSRINNSLKQLKQNYRGQSL